jgi:type VI secretion system protein ImpC
MSTPQEPRPPTLSFSIATRGAPLPPRAPESPFVIALFGDFSGRAGRGILNPVAGQTPVAIDIDNFAETLARFAPTLELPDDAAPDGVLTLGFRELDDFHPDQIAPRLPGLQRLQALRPRLSHPATSAQAAQELHALLDRAKPATTTAPESDADTLARLLGNAQPSPPPEPAAAASRADSAQAAVQRLAQQAVAGHAVAKPSASQTESLEALNRACAARLNAVLHHPRFQALESAWRSVDRLVRTFDEGDHVKLLLVDVTAEELAADLDATEDVAASGLYRLLYDSTTSQAWAVVCAFYTFGETADDIARAAKLARAGAYLSTPIIAAAHPSLAGCAGFASQPDPEKWNRAGAGERDAAFTDLRRRPEAACLGLALPRFLLRQPYGKGSDPIQGFPFEEIGSPEDHESYLWANPSMLIAELLIQRFKEDGWALAPETGGDVPDIPVHHYKAGGESLVKPGAEAWLGERAATRLRQHGLIPVLSIKNRDAVRVTGIASIGDPAQPLALRLL